MRIDLACSLAISSVLLPLSLSAQSLRVNEKATSLRLAQDRSELRLVVNNPLSVTIHARVTAKVIDVDDDVLIEARAETDIASGLHAVDLDLTPGFSSLSSAEKRRALFHRLRYSVDLDPPPPGHPRSVSGVVAFSEITPDIFELRLIGSRWSVTGRRWRAIAQAVHPIYARPVSGVEVRMEIELPAQGQTKVALSRSTDSRGMAVFEVDIPDSVGGTGRTTGEVRIVGRRAGLTASVEKEIEFLRWASLFVSTDKPLYQPGQALHARLVAFASSDIALSGAPGEWRVRDEDDETLFQAPFTTSRFGVARLDWEIPENARLGQYHIDATIDEDACKCDGRGRRSIKVSRYELPQFSVTVTPDRSYYLPGSNARIEIRADYLFGKPVTRGRARVALESQRRWSFSEQKYKIEERDSREGELDPNGRFSAVLDLSEDHEDLAEGWNRWRQFQDVDGTAYVTDGTTGRTEERRFTLRLSRLPIHVYLIERNVESCAREEDADCRADLYVSTYYADGEPARCEVRISRKRSSSYVIDEGWESETPPSDFLKSLKTNRYGLAKVVGLNLRSTRSDDDDSDGRTTLLLSAEDREGRRGRMEQTLWHTGRLLVETSRTIHAPGQPIEATITSSRRIINAVVELVDRQGVLHSRLVSLSKGRAFVTFPYEERFRGPMAVMAYATDVGGTYRAYELRGTRGVLFPSEIDLSVDISADRKQYRPGDQASIDLKLSRHDGRSAKGVVGLVVLDKALEERASSERGVPPHSGFVASLQDYFDEETIAGISIRQLLRRDTLRPVPDDLDLVAEVLLRNLGGYYPEISTSESYDTDHRAAFTPFFEDQMRPMRELLEKRYSATGTFPGDAASVRSLLAWARIPFDSWMDPWNRPYRLIVEPRRERMALEVRSSGPDETESTNDDLAALALAWPYFTLRGRIVDRAASEHYERTGDYIKHIAALRAEIARLGYDLDAWRDPWGNGIDVSFRVAGSRAEILFESRGPNGRDDPPSSTIDDFPLWTTQTEYFAKAKREIAGALDAHYTTTRAFPQNDEELNTILATHGFVKEKHSDPWGSFYYTTFKRESWRSDAIRVVAYDSIKKKTRKRTSVEPVTRSLDTITFRSRGPDGKQGTADDFDLAVFHRIVLEARNAKDAGAPQESIVFSQDRGAIGGLVTDAEGAVIPGVSVMVCNNADLIRKVTTTDEKGRYLFVNLLVGLYRVEFDLAGFKKSIITDVPVVNAQKTTVDVVLEVGDITETITVSDNTVQLQTSSGERSSSVSDSSPASSQPIVTPRLRQYFPETLFWEPEIETDERGRARVRVQLADSITTWKLGAIASTMDGRICGAEREIVVFQPFFAESDPPPVLTQGDLVHQPVLIRNYTEKTQSVSLRAEGGDGLAVEGEAQTRLLVPPSEASRTTFAVRAAEATSAGFLRATALGYGASDAVEKRLRIHPDGEQISVAEGAILKQSETIEVVIPNSAIPGSLHAELKIAPDLSAHVAESLEAILQRPYGCGEQTVSSTYPSLLVMRLLAGRQDTASALYEKAKRYLDIGYRRLLDYQTDSGGFAYWRGGDANLALSAYALRLLQDARNAADVDESVVERARAYLAREQTKDGCWRQHHWWDEDEKKTGCSAMLTATIARALATFPRELPDDDPGYTALQRSLPYLREQAEEIDDPYMLASFILTALQGDSKATARPALERLRKLAKEERSGTSWALETNTPFFGWGRAGRIETTALALQALVRGGDPSDEPVIDNGLRFLLKNQDRYGIWWSTQATVNVLHTLVDLMSDSAPPAASQPFEVLVDGRPITMLEIPDDKRVVAPLTADISPHIGPGTHAVEVRRTSAAPLASIQVAADYYSPWTQQRRVTSDELRFSVHFDRTTGAAGETFTAHVESERVGFRGYGMLLGEIGLPPGADVDRESLDRAVQESGWRFTRYDVLPDRVVVYLWPRAGGLAFDFKLSPRMAMSAKSAPSTLYDYYNPDARVVLEPTLWNITAP